jgi:enoyl-CoA hydratase/carnithine racemase
MRQQRSPQGFIQCGIQSFGGQLGIGIIELTRPEALNALNTEMLATIEKNLKTWQSDPDIACVFIHSENPKAFCSGGDVKALAASRDLEGAKAFFTQEYFTDYFVHQFKKPMVAWLDGICMGGGVGLTQGASHKIVTERTVMAMPEAFIGFFPDVGATKFLGGLADGIGTYLGLTGRKLSGATAAAIGLANYILPSSAKRQVMTDLLRMPWQGDADYNHELLSEYFTDKMLLPANEFSLGEWPKLKNIFARGDFAEIVKALPKEGRRPSLLSQAVFYRLLQKNAGKDWKQVFSQEWSTAIRFCQDTSGGSGTGEFNEGVKALLIEKRPSANWPERTIEQAWDESAAFLIPIEPNLLHEKLA